MQEIVSMTRRIGTEIIDE